MHLQIGDQNELPYFVTGGKRAGKSSYAQKLALELSDRPVYVATARARKFTRL